MSDPIVEHAITAVLTGVTGFLSAGAKFVGDLRGLEDKIVKKVKETLTDALSTRISALETRFTTFEQYVSSNVKGWSLELESLKGEIDDLKVNRGHGFASAVDYHSSDDLVRRLEKAEVDLERLHKKMTELERTQMPRERFDEFVREHNATARDLARTLGNIEGELRGRNR